MININHQAPGKSCKSHYSLILLLMLLHCDVYSTGSYFQNEQINQNKKFEFRLFENPDKTFGYNILNGDRMVIHQATIPGIEGTHGFFNKKDAVKTARLVIKKLKKGLFPPTIFDQEIKRLKIKTI